MLLQPRPRVCVCTVLVKVRKFILDSYFFKKLKLKNFKAASAVKSKANQIHKNRARSAENKTVVKPFTIVAEGKPSDKHKTDMNSEQVQLTHKIFNQFSQKHGFCSNCNLTSTLEKITKPVSSL
jgi:hypothetical protein